MILETILLLQATFNTPTLSAPTLGYTLAEGHLLRLAGLPGACYAIPDPGDASYTHILTASHAPVTLLAPASQPSVIYRTQQGDRLVSLPEPPLILGISPLGSYFAVLSSSHLRLYGRAAAPIATVALSSLSLEGPSIAGVAVGDSGQLVITTANGLWYSPTPGSPLALQAITANSPRFMPHDHLLIAYDPAQVRVIAIHPTAAFAIEPVITRDDGLTPVTGIEFDRDGTSLWVSQQSGILFSYALEPRQLSSHQLSPGVLNSVLAPGVYTWSLSDGQRAILDTTRPSPAVLLVPDQSSPAVK